MYKSTFIALIIFGLEICVYAGANNVKEIKNPVIGQSKSVTNKNNTVKVRSKEEAKKERIAKEETKDQKENNDVREVSKKEEASSEKDKDSLDTDSKEKSESVVDLIGSSFKQSAPENTDNDAQDGFANIVEKAMPGVVDVLTTQVFDEKKDRVANYGGTPFEDFFKDFFKDFMDRDAPKKVHGLGSGFIIKIDQDIAYVVTNSHVVSQSKKITVRLNNKIEVEAKLKAFDERTDIAVLEANLKNLKKGNRAKIIALSWGNSDSVKIGDWVLAFGNPFGLGSTVTNGIVSGKGRDLTIPGKGRVTDYVDDFIQHNAQINMGNSGGCLIDIKGRVIGINAAIFTPSGGNVGIGFAIPSNIAEKTVEQLITKGRTKRGWMGVQVQGMTDELIESRGLKKKITDNGKSAVIIANVTDKSPSQKAGLKQGDIIIEYDGKSLDENNRLQRLVGETEVGKVVEVKIWRNGKEMLAKVPIGEFEKAEKNGKIESKDAKSFDVDKKDDKSIEVMGLTISPIESMKSDSRSTFIINGSAVNVPNNESGMDNLPKTGVYVSNIKDDHSETVMVGDVILKVYVVEKDKEEEINITSPKQFADLIKEAQKTDRENISFYVWRGGQKLYLPFKLKLDDVKENENSTKENKTKEEKEVKIEEEKKEKEEK